MTVLQLSDREPSRSRVIMELADGPLTVAAAAELMGLGRRQVFRPPRAFVPAGPSCLISGKRRRPSNRRHGAALRTRASPVSPRPPKPTRAPPAPATRNAPMTPDWRQFASWLRRNGFSELPPEPQTVGLYVAVQAEVGTGVSALERRLSGVCWRYRQFGAPLDARDRHIATLLAGIRRKHARPPTQKEAIFTDELLAVNRHGVTMPIGEGSRT